LWSTKTAKVASVPLGAEAHASLSRFNQSCFPDGNAALLLHNVHAMFFFFSNRFGVVGSVVISLLLSGLLILLMRGCSAGGGY
jgi:hypothetical protein